MPNITLSLPSEVFALIKKHNEIRWSEVARQAIEKYANKLELIEKLEQEVILKRFDEFLAESTLTEDDIKALDEKVKESMFEKIAESMR